MPAAPSTPSTSDAPFAHSHSDTPSAPSDPAHCAEPVVTLHTQPHGPTLGTTSAPVIEVDGLLFGVSGVLWTWEEFLPVTG